MIAYLKELKPDIALSRDEANRFLPWIITLMVYLTALTLAGSFTLHRTITTGHNAQIDSFSVHLPHLSDRPADVTDRALSLVKETPGVAEATIVSATHIREMLEPWLGRSESLASLPLPVVIEAKIAPGIRPDLSLLKGRLQALAPGADIDDHKQWIVQFSQAVHMVQWVLFSIAAIILAATAAIVIFACKTSLKIHRATVNLLHRLGAFDSYIASQFQIHAVLLALKGAFVGSGLAAGTLLALYLTARHLDSPLFPSFALSIYHWFILLLLPVFTSLLALLAARTSVLGALQKMP